MVKPQFQLNPADITLREGTAISNLDGRLWQEVGTTIGRYFGDEAMVRGRIGLESRYLIALSESKIIRPLSSAERNTLLDLHTQINSSVYQQIRSIEAETRHDLIAANNIFKVLLSNSTLLDLVNHGWIHWGLTTNDIDDTARALLTDSFVKQEYIPIAIKLLNEIIRLSSENIDVVIPGKTHLQPAAPTILGKELALFGIRLAQTFETIKSFRSYGKLTGAVGNLAAHFAAFPKINWLNFSTSFIKSLGLEPNLYTTQIEPRDHQVQLYSLFHQINTISIDFCQDLRLMIGLNWLKLKAVKTEYGSSAMPQKVNPIDFENSQGNSLLSSWIFEGLIRQLPLSWLQRDLVDKTIHRNLGLPFGYSLISLISLIKGLNRIEANRDRVKSELTADWSIISEGLQSQLRVSGQADAYEQLKNLSRGQILTQTDVQSWIKQLSSGSSTKKKLSQISPETYTGYAPQITRNIITKLSKIVNNLGR